MSRVLLYAPSLIGHPHIYCRVIIDCLIRRGAKVVVASGCAPGNVGSSFPNLAMFHEHPDVGFVDTRALSGDGSIHLSVEELVATQTKRDISTTLFIEGDYFKSEFYRIFRGVTPRLHGRNVVIINNTSVWYPGEVKHSGEKIPILAPTLRGNLGRIKRFIFERQESERFFFEKILIASGIVDNLVVKDERIIEKFGRPVVLMPEIYRIFNNVESKIHTEDWNQFATPIREFVYRAGSENTVLFFGTGAWYKGYDLYLKFLELTPEAFGVHAGNQVVFEANKPFSWDVNRIRASLVRQGRLFETRRFVMSGRLIDLIFTSVERFVSTHRMTQSSGTMLQALEYGRPVLVPRAGCVCARTIKNGLGETYKYLDPHDLHHQWNQFKQTPISAYSERIRSYMMQFRQDAVEDFFAGILLT